MALAVKRAPDFPPRTFCFRDTACVLRLLKPEDAPVLQRFFYSHTQETIHYRYGYMISEMTAERAHSLVAVDQSRDFALTLSSVDHQVIYAVGRYCLDPDGKKAEVAVVVAESMRRLGLARLLIKTLVKEAGSRGLEELNAMVLADNAPVLSLFHSLKFKRKNLPVDGSMELVLKL